jgi:hypothetical protein
MSDRDFAVGTVGLPQVGKISNKPRYLVSLETPGKTKAVVHFIAFDKPDLQVGFIAVKGIYSTKSEEEIASSFAEIIEQTPKELILDLLLPTHRVVCIRSLVFNAHKPSTLPNK